MCACVVDFENRQNLHSLRVLTTISSPCYAYLSNSMERWSSWFKAPVLKTGVGFAYPGFESQSLRHFNRKYLSVLNLTRRSTQAGRRGAPAKGVGCLRGARVRISPSPPKFDRSIYKMLRSILLLFISRKPVIQGICPIGVFKILCIAGFSYVINYLKALEAQ